MEIRLLETAKEDLRAGYWFYENQAAGVGDYFLDCIQADVRSLQVFAGIHESAEGFFRMLSKRFPFAIYYLITCSAAIGSTSTPFWIADVTRPGSSRSCDHCSKSRDTEVRRWLVPSVSEGSPTMKRRDG